MIDTVAAAIAKRDPTAGVVFKIIADTLNALEDGLADAARAAASLAIKILIKPVVLNRPKRIRGTAIDNQHLNQGGAFGCPLS